MNVRKEHVLLLSVRQDPAILEKRPSHFYYYPYVALGRGTLAEDQSANFGSLARVARSREAAVENLYKRRKRRK